MENIFINALNMSLTASYCAAIVLCVRLCIRRLPKVYSYVLWLVVFLRFAVPFSLESMYSFVRISNRSIPADIGLQQTPQISTGLGQIDDTANRFILMAFPQADTAASVNPLQIIISVAAWIWLAVAAGLVCYGLVSYGILKHRIRDAVYVEGNVYVTGKIPTPFVMGILKPRIYLPKGLLERERQYIISHEQVHLNRYDYLVKLLAFIIVCFHWFNPMAWISLLLMCRDMELSCDEQVLSMVKLDGEERTTYKKEYAAALLTVASGRRIQIFEPLFFCNRDVRRRIQNVLGFKQRRKVVTYVSVVLILLAAVGLMGSRKMKPSESEYISVTVWRYDVPANAIESYGDIVTKENPAFRGLETLLEKYYYNVEFHSFFAENDYLNEAGTSIVIKGENGNGFCVRDDGSAAVCKTDGGLYEYHLEDGVSIFNEIEDLLLRFDIVYHTTTTSSEAEDLNAVLRDAGHTHVCRIPEEYWAGIEGLGHGEKAYPIILGTDGVYDNRDGNMTTIVATLYCVSEDGLKEIGEVSSGGTAYPLQYGQTGIYLCSNHIGNRLTIDTKTWELKIAERVQVEYSKDSQEKYYYETGGEVRDSNEAEFAEFFDQCNDAVVMDFEELP